MPPQSITYRSASPTLEEGRLFARYLDQAAEGFFRFMLGRRVEEILATAYAQPQHDLSYQNVTFAERGTSIVGMVSGYTSEQHRRSTIRPLFEAAGKWNLRLIIISTLFAPLLRIIDTIADGDFYLQAIAVDKQLRGEGVGSALMDYAEGCARAGGSRRITLDVSAGNETACSLYNYRGMVVESQWPKRIKLPGLSFLRMTKTL